MTVLDTERFVKLQKRTIHPKPGPCVKEFDPAPTPNERILETPCEETSRTLRVNTVGDWELIRGK